ncbi:hypothetical protein LZ554_003701 [Drepanopeziza brunnea f. sp. 'monogermtubi']|nr:hypothetical protein LZ554_003701 [Drepanopeziza brunnea f. sp. 'monogermtubi']
MEGAMHTFVTPIVPRYEIEGDYSFAGGHQVLPFGNMMVSGGAGEGGERSVRRTRSVVTGAAIQLDFEQPVGLGAGQVMGNLCTLRSKEVVGGGDLLNSGAAAFQMPTRPSAQTEQGRSRCIRCRAEGALNAKNLAGAADHHHSRASSPSAARRKSSCAYRGRRSCRWRCSSSPRARPGRLERVLAPRAAVPRFRATSTYTYDPASVFAGAIVGAAILNRLFIAAVRHLAAHTPLRNMAIFGFNDYAEERALALLASALATYDVGKWKSSGDDDEGSRSPIARDPPQQRQRRLWPDTSSPRAACRAWMGR